MKHGSTRSDDPLRRSLLDTIDTPPSTLRDSGHLRQGHREVGASAIAASGRTDARLPRQCHTRGRRATITSISGQVPSRLQAEEQQRSAPASRLLSLSESSRRLGGDVRPVRLVLGLAAG
jgi:hypothetical protein